MIFSKVRLAKHKKFAYDRRYSADKDKSKVLSFREEGAFLARTDELAGGIRNLKYAKRLPDRKANKITKFALILGLMGTIYAIYSDEIQVAENFGGDLSKSLGGFVILFLLLFIFIKKSNSSV